MEIGAWQFWREIYGLRIKLKTDMDQSAQKQEERREFLKKLAAMACGGAATLVPVGAGVAVMLDPLRRKAGAQESTRITTLASLPADGIPRKFSIISSRVDAWNRYEAIPIGAVYLRKTEDNHIEAFNVACPHAGCFVDFLPEKNSFLCPCHNSTFAINGKINDPKSPSPRPLDRLKVQVIDGEVWVQFQNFRSGEREQIPQA